MMMGHVCGGAGWAHWVWVAETFLLWAVVIAAVVLGVRYLASVMGPSTPAVRAPHEEGLLAERYARGEIDDEEFERRTAVLKQHR